MHVRYFAAAAEAAGREEEVLDVDADATVGDLGSALVERYGPVMARVVATGSFLVDGIVTRDPGTPPRRARRRAAAVLRRVRDCATGSPTPWCRRQVLALPDGSALLDPVDEIRARREGVGAMRRGDARDQRDVADDEASDAMGGGHAHAELLGDLLAHGAQERLGLRMRLVVEQFDALAVVVVADDALEGDHRAVRGVSTKASMAARSSGSVVTVAKTSGMVATVPAAGELVDEVRQHVAEHSETVAHAARASPAGSR